MHRITLLTLAGLLALAQSSCGPSSPMPIPLDWKWVWVGNTTAWFAIRDQNLGAIVWVDRHAEPGFDVQNGRIRGHLRAATESVDIKIDCQFTYETSSISIDGKPYDLTKGTIFLVSTHQVPPKVMQLATNISGYPPAPTAVKALSDNDPQVGAFVQAAASPIVPTTGPIGPPAPSGAGTNKASGR